MFRRDASFTGYLTCVRICVWKNFICQYRWLVWVYEDMSGD